MEREIDRMVSLFEEGKMTRRQLVAHVSAVAAAAALGGRSGRAEAATVEEPTFQAQRIDHIALRVSDVPRSRDWYAQHLGLEITARDSESSSFLNCGDDFVALFRRGETPGLDHYSFAINNYNADDAMARIQEAGLDGERRGNRVYFPDPDGIVVQVASG